METKEERLLKAIFGKGEEQSEEEPNDYPKTYVEKVGYAEFVITHTLQDISSTIWRLSRLSRLLLVSEKDGENTLPDIITNNELRMALKPLLLVENDISEITKMLAELYIATTRAEAEEKGGA